MVGVPSQVPVEELLVRADEERSGAAGRVEDPQGRGGGRCLPFQELSDSVIDDVVDDVCGV